MLHLIARVEDSFIEKLFLYRETEIYIQYLLQYRSSSTPTNTRHLRVFDNLVYCKLFSL